jgi:hypothetical protein
MMLGKFSGIRGNVARNQARQSVSAMRHSIGEMVADHALTLFDGDIGVRA